MNAIELMLQKQMSEECFQCTTSDNFSFVDSLIEQSDIDKYKEAINNGSND